MLILTDQMSLMVSIRRYTVLLEDVQYVNCNLSAAMTRWCLGQGHQVHDMSIHQPLKVAPVFTRSNVCQGISQSCGQSCG